MTYHPGTIILHSRRYVNPLDLKQDEIDILDIAHSLAHYCRFGGHSPKFYSIAEHSVEVSYWLQRQGGHPMLQLAGLLHDANECYMPDITNPLKRSGACGGLVDLEDKLLHQIFKRFEIEDTNEVWRFVREADADLLRSECVSLWGCQPSEWGLDLPKDYVKIGGVRPRDAKVLFEQRFTELQIAIKEGA